MTALLERVKFIGGNGGGEPVDEDALPGMPDAPAAEPLDPDPEPDKKARRKPRNTGPAAARPAGRPGQRSNAGKFTSRATVQKQMADEVETYANMLALAWSMSDEVCAPVLSQQSRAIADSLAACMARSDWIVERFQQTGAITDAIRLLHASLPVLRAVYVHHVAGRRGGDEGEGSHDAVSFDTAEYPAYAAR